MFGTIWEPLALIHASRGPPVWQPPPDEALAVDVSIAPTAATANTTADNRETTFIDGDRK
jgi:hypothetical protein